MQSERQIAVFCIALGGALAYPEVRFLMAHADQVPGGQLMTGGGFGALGVFFGTLLALDGDSLWAKGILTTFWAALAIGFAAAMAYGALRSPGAVRMALFLGFGGLDLLACFGTMFGVWYAEHKRRTV